MSVDPQKLFNYARDRAEVEGAYPTFKDCASHFGVSMSAIEEACDSFDGDGYLGAIVGTRIGNGVAEIKRKSEYLVEAYI